jgi:hypothetical protein
MNHSIDIPDSAVETTWIFKVVNFNEIEQGRKFWPGLDHSVPLGQRARSPPHTKSTAEELIDHMSPNETSCSGHKDISSTVLNKPPVGKYFNTSHTYIGWDIATKPSGGLVPKGGKEPRKLQRFTPLYLSSSKCAIEINSNQIL